jgi:hypothetical protein
MEITESYLKGNYQRYLESCKEDAEQPKPYDEWRKWFIETFGVIVAAAS